jgi:hypothetical protein
MAASSVLEFKSKATLEAEKQPDKPDAFAIAGEDSEDDDVDMSDAVNRAHAFCGALSTLDLVEVTPEEFWCAFGAKGLKASTLKWVTNAVKKLNAIKKGA